MSRTLVAALASCCLAGCAPGGAAQPTASPSPRPAVSGSPSPTTARLQLSDAPIGAPDSRPFILFQAAGDARLRGLSWDGSTIGLFTNSGPFGMVLQSPDGRYAVLGDGIIYDRHGRKVGPFPWQEKDMRATWSPDSTVMCKVPDLGVSGGTMRLEMAAPGQSPKVVAQGFGAFHDQSAYPVLACDPHTDRAVVAEMAQGFSLMHVWVFHLSTGALIRSLSPSGGSIAASSDGRLLGRTPFPNAGQTSTTTIERTDDGTVLGSIADFEIHGFSGDSSTLVGLRGSPHRPLVVNWRSQTTVWKSNAGPYFGYLAEPGGSHIIVGLIAADGSLGDAYLVGPDGSALLLPAGVSIATQP